MSLLGKIVVGTIESAMRAGAKASRSMLRDGRKAIERKEKQIKKHLEEDLGIPLDDPRLED